MIVLHASAAIHLYTNAGELAGRLRKRLAGESLIAPHLLDIEFASALVGMHRGGKVTTEVRDLAWRAFAALPVRRVAHLPLLQRVLELTSDYSAYDATYLALAEACGCGVVTGDARIGRAGVARCPVEVFG